MPMLLWARLLLLAALVTVVGCYLWVELRRDQS
jgi:hypothetical protein